MKDPRRAFDQLLTELDRLRSEVDRQRERAHEAGKALWDHLVAGGRREDVPALDQELQNAAHQLLVAVAGIRRTARAVLSLTGYEPMHQAIDDFGKRAQDASAFRDFFEHFDDYVRGQGNLSDRYMWPDHAEMALFPDGEVIFGLHGNPRQLIVSVSGAADAGTLLAMKVLEMRDALSGVLEMRARD